MIKFNPRKKDDNLLSDKNTSDNKVVSDSSKEFKTKSLRMAFNEFLLTDNKSSEIKIEKFKKEIESHLFVSDNSNEYLPLYKEIILALLEKKNEMIFKDKLSVPIKEPYRSKKNNLDIDEYLPNKFESLRSIFEEIIEDNQKEGIECIKALKPFLIDLEQILLSSIDGDNIDIVDKKLTDMMSNIQNFEISQRKYIYKLIADVINNSIKGYQFISTEDSSMVDVKYHEVVSGSGQRISKGVSYIVIDSNNNSIIKFGKVKTN